MQKINTKALCQSLTDSIQKAYESQVTIPEAEALAAKFLHGSILVGSALRTVDLDARMRKSGLKAIKAEVYLNAIKSSEKKPTEAALESMINVDPTVREEQNALDNAEVTRDELKNYLAVFHEAHVFFRGISKGKFE